MDFSNPSNLILPAPSRRGFLRQIGMGAGSLAFTQMLHQQGLLANVDVAGASLLPSATSPMSVKPRTSGPRPSGSSGCS
jgi:hypothetical protein